MASRVFVTSEEESNRCSTCIHTPRPDWCGSVVAARHCALWEAIVLPLYCKTKATEDNQALCTLDREAQPQHSAPLARKHTAWPQTLPLWKWGRGAAHLDLCLLSSALPSMDLGCLRHIHFLAEFLIDPGSGEPSIRGLKRLHLGAGQVVGERAPP